MAQRIVQLFDEFPISLTLHNTENSLFKILNFIFNFKLQRVPRSSPLSLSLSLHFLKLNLKKFRGLHKM